MFSNISQRLAGNCYLYKREDSFTSGDMGADFRYNAAQEDDDDDDEDDLEYLHDIPYSSSSLDRSSIGSIPWADDAIKKNQVDWEHVENMLSGQVVLTEETELRNEILEWQRKFPQLLNDTANGGDDAEKRLSIDSSNNNIGDSLDINSISNLNLNSLLDDDAHSEDNSDELDTPTNEAPQNGHIFNRQRVSANSREPALHTLKQKTADAFMHQLDQDLLIQSVPLRLRQKVQARKNSRLTQQPQEHKLDSFTSTLLPPTPPLRRTAYAAKDLNVPIVPPSANVRMPPILNVLESKRRFLGLTNNRSFVQLTPVQQTKSAAVTSQQRARNAAKSAWQVPIAAVTMSGRFFNNRNSIILPSINMQRAHEQVVAMHGNFNELRSTSNSTLGSAGMGRSMHFNANRQQHADYNRGTTTTTTTTPSTGRSISAAVHAQTRNEFNAFYLPYSASKFKVFK